MPSILVFGELVLGKRVVESGAVTQIGKDLPTPQQNHQGCLEEQGGLPGEKAAGWFLKACVIPAAGSGQCSMPRTVCGLCPARGHAVKEADESEIQPHPPTKRMERHFLPVLSKALGRPVAAWTVTVN